MKNLIRTVSIVGLLSISFVAYADSITDSYATGDTLDASTLNNIKSAVNDNDSRITALEAAPKANIATTAPTVNDDINSGYPEGSVWVDMTDRDAYILIDSAPGAAVWKPITPIYRIGDKGPAGGIIFYVTDDGVHGLEAAPVDLANAEWGCQSTTITTVTEIGAGAQNTADILAACPTAGIAARLADTYTLNGYADWFLPSKDELNELYLNRGIVGGFASITYWSSSSDHNLNFAWFQNLDAGGQGNTAKNNPQGVRAVRAF